MFKLLKKSVKLEDANFLDSPSQNYQGHEFF